MINPQQVVPFRAAQRSDFEIQCDGCSLPAKWATHLLSDDIRENVPNAELLVVCGHNTPSRNLKYLPMLRGVLLATADGWTGPLIIWSSGNAALSAKIILKERGLKNRLIAGVSTNLPEAKRLLLEQEGIELITEKDLREALGPEASASPLMMIEEYAKRNGMRLLDQYFCDWNWPSYMPIPEQTIGRIGPVSAIGNTPGTKGKYNGVCMPFRQRYRQTAIVLVYPTLGLFPGGRNETTIKEVRNQFIVEPTAVVHVTEEDAYKCAAKHVPYINGGITYGGEVEGLQVFLRQMYDEGRIKELELPDGSIILLAVASDSIFPYIQEGKKRLPELYGRVESLLHRS
jgi:cysteine synthase